jgi:hypothetical protein
MSPQQAVRLLSLRIPERAAAGSIAPQALLQSRGAAGAPGGDPMGLMIQQLMRAFVPGLQSGEPPSAVPSMASQMPRIIPGLDETKGNFLPMGQPPPEEPPLYPGQDPPPGLDMSAEIRKRIPMGGIAGGTGFDPGAAKYNPSLYEPLL